MRIKQQNRKVSAIPVNSVSIKQHNRLFENVNTKKIKQTVVIYSCNQFEYQVTEKNIPEDIIYLNVSDITVTSRNIKEHNSKV